MDENPNNENPYQAPEQGNPAKWVITAILVGVGLLGLMMLCMCGSVTLIGTNASAQFDTIAKEIESTDLKELEEVEHEEAAKEAKEVE